MIPSAAADTSLRVTVTGAAVGGFDFADTITDKLPILVAIMLIAGMLVLLMTFRSVLIVVIAAVANTAVLGAAAGIIVLVFGHGWGSALLGAGSAGPVESVVPVLIVGVMFGLSMDYGMLTGLSSDTPRTIEAGAVSVVIVEGTVEGSVREP
ncbi:MMPL family transporter [Gordonia sp. VNQ95]|uniref:MMPL family transporter n=1 Tax=Gordonia TaxID=2053 RepID=UPI0032B49BC4